MEAGAQTLTAIAQREDFLATGDPALREESDTGRFQLLDYTQLYELWERQQWATQDLDFSKDRADWLGFSSDERYQRMYGLSAFFIGEQRVTDELGPIMRAAPTEEMRIFLSTQIADEARHVRFFNRFYDEVGALE
ncbi:MAG: ribonucleotide-diphosphate reductase subunit beta, partial [Solirubrobacterales bacterium]